MEQKLGYGLLRNVSNTKWWIQVMVFWVVIPCCGMVGYQISEDCPASIFIVKMDGILPHYYKVS